MDAKVVVADQPWSIEQHAIEPIPAADRHGSPIELFRLWIGANVNYLVLITGALTITNGLSLTGAMTAILIGNILGCAVVGLASIMGPKTGTAGIIASRVSFGQLGAVLPIFISTVAAIGWFSINSVLAQESLAKVMNLLGMPHASWVGASAMLLVLTAEILVAIYGHATIIAAEKAMSVALIVLFLGFLAFVLPQIDWQAMRAARAAQPAGFATWLLVTGLIFSYPLSWTNFASDYSRYLPASTSWRRIAVAAGGGQLVALVFCEIVGVMFAMALKGTLSDPVADLPRVLPDWYLLPFLFAVIVGSIATNVPNGYTAGLGLLALRLPLRRVPSLLLIALATLAFRIFTLIYGHALDLYEQWLTYLLAWTAPWIAVIVVDYFMRDGCYSARDLMLWRSSGYWYSNGVRWAGVSAFIAGLAASLTFSNSDLYASPLMTRYLGGTDLSFEAGMVVAGLTYFLLARPAVLRERHQGELLEE